jgi:prefoldin subunit 5
MSENISAIEERLNTAIYNLHDRIEKINKRHDSTSWLLRHTMQKLYVAEEKIQRQGSQIASLKKKLEKASDRDA